RQHDACPERICSVCKNGSMHSKFRPGPLDGSFSNMEPVDKHDAYNPSAAAGSFSPSQELARSNFPALRETHPTFNGGPCSSHPMTSLQSAPRTKARRSSGVGPGKPRWLAVLGPGLITGASDDDPSGIATYSQAGARFGFGLLWTSLLTVPLMAAVQEICDRTALATGDSLGRLAFARFPRLRVRLAGLHGTLML